MCYLRCKFYRYGVRYNPEDQVADQQGEIIVGKEEGKEVESSLGKTKKVK